MSTNFERGLDPLVAMGAGKCNKPKAWIEKNNMARASHTAKYENNAVTINVEGDVVLGDFNGNIEGTNVKFGNVTGHITILDQLTPTEIYARIREFYKKIIDNCIGKSHIEQEKYLSDLLETNRSFTLFNLKHGAIEAIEDYILSLPDEPSPEQIVELIKQVKQGSLEFLSQFKNDKSVEIKQYAKALK
jgi:hypothetical protein